MFKTHHLFYSLLSVTTLTHGALAADKQHMPTIVVTTPAEEGTMTVPSNAEAVEIITRTPGGVAVVDSEHYDDRYAMNFEDTLAYVPGVYAQSRFGEEVRLAIRGSGLSRGFHMRGITLLQDGIPFNLADGAADFQEADSLAMQRLEVYKGGNALQYGATSLGGAVNMVTHTGRSHEGDTLRAEIGSENTYRMNAQSGRVFGDSDVFLSLSGTTSEGFQRHEEQSNLKFNGNLGTRISDDVETRFYLSGNIVEQELPGSVSRTTALNNPEAADTGAIANDWGRDIRSVRVANKTSFAVGDDDQIDIGAFANMKDLVHPISPGVVDHESIDYGVFAQGAGEYKLAEHRNRYRGGLTVSAGTNDAKLYANAGGSRGALRSDTDQDAQNVLLYGENQFFVHPEWALVTGGQMSWSNREVTDHINPAESDEKDYAAFNPKVGVLYEPQEKLQVFANVSRSYEPPTFSELTQSGTTGFTPVSAQKAWTAEVGSRGETGPVAWDVSLYRAWLKDEMLQFTTGSGIPASTFNAEDTVHQGVELGLDLRLGRDLLAAGDHLQWRNAYTFSDFHFDGDAQFGDNDIPGQPAHFYQTELRYDGADGWFVAPNVELANEADVDFANSFTAPGYALLGLNAGYDVTDGVSLFFDGRNLLDKNYISTFSTIVNTAGNTAVFYPGDGRRVFGGVKISL